MEQLKNLLLKLKSLPMIGKVISVIIALLALIIFLFFSTSCGASKSTVKVFNRAESTTTSVSMTNGNGGSTSVTVSPDVTVRVDSSKLF